MSEPWTPEHPVDAALAARLVGDQFPDLAEASPVRVGQGWDCDVWRFGDLAFRFPRRGMGVTGVRRELAVLPDLAPRLPLAVPVPARVGRPTDEYPAPFYGHAFLAGTPLDAAAPSDEDRERLVAPLARFLEALGAVDLDEARALGVPDDEVGRGDLGRRVDLSLERLARLAGGPLEDAAGWLEAELSAPRPPAVGPPRLCHGDLYARHLLVDDQGDLAGVLDWEDVCLGDRAMDLSVAFTVLPPDARDRLLDSLGEGDPQVRARARLFGVNYAEALGGYAARTGDAVLLAEVRRMLGYLGWPG